MSPECDSKDCCDCAHGLVLSLFLGDCSILPQLCKSCNFEIVVGSRPKLSNLPTNHIRDLVSQRVTWPTLVLPGSAGAERDRRWADAGTTCNSHEKQEEVQVYAIKQLVKTRASRKGQTLSALSCP